MIIVENIGYNNMKTIPYNRLFIDFAKVCNFLFNYINISIVIKKTADF